MNIQLDLFHFIFIGIILILVISITYLIGRGKKEKGIKITADRKLDSSQKKLVPLDTISLNKQAKKRPKKNEKYLKDLESLVRTKLIEYSELITDMIASAFFNYHNPLADYLDQIDDDDFGIDNFEKSINWVKVNSIKSEFETNYNTAADIIISLHNDTIEGGVDLYKDDELKKYFLTEDQKILEKNKIIAILKQDMNPCYVELNELTLIQNKLK